MLSVAVNPVFRSWRVLVIGDGACCLFRWISPEIAYGMLHHDGVAAAKIQSVAIRNGLRSSSSRGFPTGFE